MATTRTSEILQAVSDSDLENLSQKVKKLSAEKCLTETVTEFTRRQLDQLWDELLPLCVSKLLNDTPEQQTLSETSSLLQCVVDLAHATIETVRAEQNEEADEDTVVVARQDGAVLPHSLQEMAVILHGVIPTLTDALKPLKNSLCKLFEDWWLYKMPLRQEVIPNTLMYLLHQSTEPTGTQKDVSRVSSLQMTLNSADLGSESASELVTLLLQCVHHHHYVNTSPGLKFLVHLFTLNSDLIGKLHQTVKNHLNSVPKSWLDKYGEMYFRAWQKSSGDMRAKLEQDCLQDLMFHAVHAQRGSDRAMASVLFRVLKHIHKQKSQRGVDAMLHDLYEPILWRALAAPNSDVRVNAATILFEVFPLQDPCLLQEEADRELQRQFSVIYDLLSDPVVEVRVVAVKGVGSILNWYWELMPSQVAQYLLSTLVQDLAYDCSSPAVREAVIKVMTQLCDNPLCIPVLKRILPEFRNFVHDTSERVRMATLDLLLKVKGLRAIKFWSITPVEHVLARLELDSPAVTRKVMRLVAPSFVPLDLPPADQIERIVTLIKENHGAARQFFIFLPQQLGLQETVRYITTICIYLLESSRHNQSHRRATPDGNENEADSQNGDEAKENSASSGRASSPKKTGAKKSRKARKKGKGNENIEEEGCLDGVEDGAEDSGEATPQEQWSVYAGLVEGVYLMYTYILNKLSSPENKSLKEGIAKKLSVTVRELMAFSQHPSLDTALIALAGQLPAHGLPLLGQNLLNKLKAAPPQGSAAGEPLLAGSEPVMVTSLVLWGRTEALVELIRGSVEKLLNVGGEEDEELVGKKASAKKGKKRVGFAVEEEKVVEPERALAWLVDMITPSECRPVLLGKHKRHLARLLASMRHATAALETWLVMQSEAEGSATVVPENLPQIIRVQELYLRLGVFLMAGGGGLPDKENQEPSVDQDALGQVKYALSWAKRVLLPGLDSNLLDQKRKETAVELMEASLKVGKSVLLVGAGDRQLFDLVVDLCVSSLQRSLPSTPLLLPTALGCLYQMTQVRPCQNEGEDVDEASKKSLDMKTCLEATCKFLEMLSWHLAPLEGEATSNPGNSGRILASVTSGLNEVIQELSKPGQPIEVVETLLTSVVESSLQELTLSSEKDTLGPAEQVPSLTAALLSMVRKRKACRRVFLDLVTGRVKDSLTIHQLHALTALVDACRHTKDFTDMISPSLERRIAVAVAGAQPQNLDETVFRDVRSQVESRLQSWNSSAGQPDRVMET